ncbi:helix-turn-helix transcriptional regulator [Phaeobacter inhibens]|uniref:helix-turn-helix transcriptional regulator n=1 Tax=Phaeobacter inhibens TaxID=221822 RepID=UPI0028833207|nr:helix-turn-helix domain-containing protein [Phaeobacter inhibens]
MMLNTEMTPDANAAAQDYLNGFIDEKTTADFLCQSVRTIQKWRVTGYGPKFYKSGRSVRYRRSDLLEWANVRRHGSTSSYSPA